MLLSGRERTGVRIALVVFLSLVVSFVGAGLGAAHEGHDHGPPAPPLPATVTPRVAVETELYQLVAIARGAELTIFLDQAGTNEPITDATIAVLAGDQSVTAAPRRDGSYGAIIAAITVPRRHDLVFNISHKLGDDLLAGTLDIGARAATVQPASSAEQPTVFRRWLPYLTLALGIALGIIIGSRRSLRIVGTAAIAMVLLAMILPIPAVAHEGHDASPVPEGPSLAGDLPRRLPDGSVFLPKPSQRLLTVRSQVVVSGEARRGISLVGRIIADPNRSGIVQSIAGGRVSAPDAGLPRLGQMVKRGDELARVDPALPLADQSTLAEKQRELEGAILLARQKRDRLAKVGSPVIARGVLEDGEVEIMNLERRLASLKTAKLQPELLTAPIDGIVSTSRVVAGQVVGAQDILFQIVDPASMWVEAMVFDQLDPGAVTEATAVMPDGSAMRLSYRGRGRSLQAQSLQMQFAIEEPPARAVLGLPVTVLARKAEPVRGMLLARDAVVRGAAGEMIVWQQIEPERFVTRQVRIEPFDGDRVLITGGLSPNDRIVVHGAELLSQVR